MSAWVQDLEIEQGATFALGFVYYDPVIDPITGEVELDVDGNPVPGAAKPLTGCTARMQIKKKIKDTEADITTVTGTSEAYDQVNAPYGGRIILEAGGVTGRVDIVFTDADTDLITYTEGVYDLEIEYPLQVGSELRPFVERVLEGAIVNTLNVTKVDT